MPSCALAIEDAGDHGIRIEGRQPAHERDRILVGAYRGRQRARERQINLSERAAPAAQGEARRGPVALDFDFRMRLAETVEQIGYRRQMATAYSPPPANCDPCDVRFDVRAAIITGYGLRKRSPTAERRR